MIICVVERGEDSSNEPMQIFCTNDEPRGDAATHSPDECRFGADKEMKKACPIMAKYLYLNSEVMHRRSFTFPLTDHTFVD